MAMFDTLRASRQLREAGFEEAQADALVSTFAEGVAANLSTKDDLKQLEQRMTIRPGAMVATATGIIIAAIAIAG